MSVVRAKIRKVESDVAVKFKENKKKSLTWAAAL